MLSTFFPQLLQNSSAGYNTEPHAVHEVKDVFKELVPSKLLLNDSPSLSLSTNRIKISGKKNIISPIIRQIIPNVKKTKAAEENSGSPGNLSIPLTLKTAVVGGLNV